MSPKLKDTSECLFIKSWSRITSQQRSDNTESFVLGYEILNRLIITVQSPFIGEISDEDFIDTFLGVESLFSLSLDVMMGNK